MSMTDKHSHTKRCFRKRFKLFVFYKTRHFIGLTRSGFKDDHENADWNGLLDQVQGLGDLGVADDLAHNVVAGFGNLSII